MKPTLSKVRLACSCAGSLTVVVVDGAVACSRCTTPLVAEPPAAPEFFDQNASPLGKRLHLKLAPELGGVRAGKRVLIRREAIEAYLAAHPVARAPKPQPSPAPVDTLDAVLADLGACRSAAS